jgi:hypothetical protein
VFTHNLFTNFFLLSRYWLARMENWRSLSQESFDSQIAPPPNTPDWRATDDEIEIDDSGIYLSDIVPMEIFDFDSSEPEIIEVSRPEPPLIELSSSCPSVASSQPEFIDITWTVPNIPHSRLRRTFSCPDLAKIGTRCRRDFSAMKEQLDEQRFIRLSQDTLMGLADDDAPECQIYGGIYDLKALRRKIAILSI